MAQLFNVTNPDDYVEYPDSTCFLAYRGSIAHGMHDPKPDSIDDVDLIGFVMAEPKHYIGLSQWGSRGTREVKQGRWDMVLYEFRKAVSLLLQGNPNILSSLWVRHEDRIFVDGIGRMLIENRSLFRGKHVYNAFAGYAHAQLEKMESRDPMELRRYLAVTAELKYRGAHPNHKGEQFPEPDRLTGVEHDVACWSLDKLMSGLRHYQKKGENIGYMGDKRKQLVLEMGFDSKNAAHCIRLLRMAGEFLQTGEMIVYRPDAAELLNIKRGLWTLDEIKEHANDLFARLKLIRAASSLPDEPDYAAVEKLVMNCVHDHLGKTFQYN